MELDEFVNGDKGEQTHINGYTQKFLDILYNCGILYAVVSVGRCGI